MEKLVILADDGWVWGAAAIALVIGLVIGFFVSRWFFKREMKKNPPINEKMIRAMYSQMGRKPSEAQVRAIMNSVKRNS